MDFYTIGFNSFLFYWILFHFFRLRSNLGFFWILGEHVETSAQSESDLNGQIENTSDEDVTNQTTPKRTRLPRKPIFKNMVFLLTQGKPKHTGNFHWRYLLFLKPGWIVLIGPKNQRWRKLFSNIFRISNVWLGASVCHYFKASFTNYVYKTRWVGKFTVFL